VLDVALSVQRLCAEQVAPMEFVRGSLAAVALNNKLYAMGGGQPNVNRDSTEVYDAHHNAWLTGPTMNHRRFTTAAALHNNSIFVSGGYDGTQYLRSVERLDPREGKWQMVRFSIGPESGITKSTQTYTYVTKL